MKLKHRIVKPKKRFAKPRLEIFFENGWFTLNRLSSHSKYRHLGLTQGVLYHRWIKNIRTEKELFKPKRGYKFDEEKRADAWLYEKCTPEQIKAMEIGTNKALLDI